MLSGPAGVGKTTLLRWLVREACSRGAVTAHRSCAGPFLLSDLVSGRGRLDVVLPETGRGPDLGLETGVRAELTEQAVRRFLDEAQRRTVVLALDDAEEAGIGWQQTALSLVRELDERAVVGGPCGVVALATRVPITADSLIDQVLRLPVVRDLALEGLAPDDVTDLVTSAGGDPAAYPGLYADTAGLPLLVEAAIDRGPRKLRVRTLAEALERRFDKVDGTVRDLLTTAAHLWDPWTASELALVAGVLPSVVLDAHVAGADAHLLEADGELWRFAHPLIRSKLLDETGPSGTEAEHLKIAEALAAVDDTGPAGDADLLARRARHLVAAGARAHSADVVDVAGRAGELAYRSGRWELAALLLGGAADAADDEVVAGQADRHLLAGRAAYMAHDPDRAEEHLRRAFTLARASGALEVRLQAATLLARTRLGERPLALGGQVDISELVTSLDEPSTDPSAVVLGRAVVAEALLVANESERALSLVATTRSTDLVGANETSLGELEFGEGIHRLRQLELVRAHECFVDAERRGKAAGVRLDEISARTRRLLVDLLRGDVSSAAGGATSTVELALTHGLHGEASLACAVVAIASVLRGGTDATLEVERATRLAHRGRLQWSAELLTPAAIAHVARLGRPDPASGSAAGAGSSALAVLAAIERGDDLRARSALATARWRHGFRGPPTLGNLGVLVALVDAGDLLGEPELVGAASKGLDALGDREVVVVTAWPALVPRLRATVARHDGRILDAHRHLDHAAHCCRAHRLEGEMARVELELARLAQLEGASAQQVGAHLTVAIERFDRLGMFGWMGRCDGLARQLALPPLAVDHLSERERTLLTTDIVGSTAANARLGDALYLEQLRVHDRLLRARLREHRGLEIKHTGDGINACFEHAADAARCALAVQADLLRWQHDDPELALRVRCGLATGPVIASDGDFYGLLQSEAARLCAAAGVGEVIASGGAASWLSVEEFTLTPLGQRELRGLPTPVELFRVQLSALGLC